MEQTTNQQIVYIGSDQESKKELGKLSTQGYHISSYTSLIECYQKIQHKQLVPDIIICDEHLRDESLNHVYKHFQKNIITRNIPFCVLMDKIKKKEINELKGRGITDVIIKPIAITKHGILIKTLLKIKSHLIKNTKEIDCTRFQGTPFLKRSFDIVVATSALIILLPLILVVAIAIRIESKGPVFYYSKRVGSGYKTFNFFKLRSMYFDADKRLKKIEHSNQYRLDQTKLKTESKFDLNSPTLYADGREISEVAYLSTKSLQKNQSFSRRANDPRITKVGLFIRNTSIDVLPQLFNVIKGDMSIVGNRPLPLYEAEILTTDDWSQRFLAPAGIIGLWQVKNSRQAGEMSNEERKKLDNEYSKNFSLLYDIKLILMVIPALFQKENV